MKEKLSYALDALPERMIDEAADVQQFGRSRVQHMARRITAIAAALAMLVSIGVPALAAGNEAFNEALYRVFPGLAQAMKPVQLTCEDNGIRMEVISARVENGTANVYLSIQDLTGDRIDETVDLFDSFHMNLPADCITGHCEQIAYDPDTHAATFLCTLEGWDAAKLSNKVTCSLRCFISGKQTLTCDVMTFVPAELAAGPSWEGVVFRGYGSNEGDRPIGMQMLLPQAQPLAEPVAGVQLTGLAYLDGQLHVQHHYQDIKYLDNHGFPMVLDPDGHELWSDYQVSAHDQSHIGSYEDDVYTIPSTDTRPYTLRGEYTIATQYMEGRWQVTFPVGE